MLLKCAAACLALTLTESTVRSDRSIEEFLCVGLESFLDFYEVFTLGIPIRQSIQPSVCRRVTQSSDRSIDREMNRIWTRCLVLKLSELAENLASFSKLRKNR